MKEEDRQTKLKEVHLYISMASQPNNRHSFEHLPSCPFTNAIFLCALSYPLSLSQLRCLPLYNCHSYVYFNSYLSLSFSQLRNLLSTTAITSIATPLSLSQPKYLPLYKPHSFVHLATCTHLSLSLSQPRHAYLHMYMYNLHVHVSTVCNRHSTPHTCRPPLRDQISAAL